MQFNLLNLAALSSKNDELPEPTQEMVEWFESRTKRHIELVQKYAKKIEELDPQYKGLREQAETHDASKLKEPERTPYIFISWQYRCKDLGKKFDPPAALKDLMNKATEHHVKHNPHHPEYHTSSQAGLINRENRDKPPKEMVDGTKMPQMDLAGMVADWLAMAEEKGNTAKSWAEKNVNIRWKFTAEQEKEIYRLIKLVEGE
jgi:hypothetical protein